MKFGHVNPEEIDQIDFTLPQDHPDNIKKAGGEMKIFSGCGKWGIDEWVGLIYPEKTKSADFLTNYIQHFNSIELNATFYRLSRTSIKKWAEVARETGFKYCPKYSQRVSHLKRLNEVDENIKYFADSISEMGDSLGISFLQMPDNFTPKYIERLAHFTEVIPKGFPVAIELRHKEWFGNEEVSKEMYSLLAEYNIPLIITDTATRRDVIHQRLTSDKVFIRFQGYGFHPTDYSRIDDWVDRLKKWKEEGIKEVYFFMHQGDEKNTPATVDYFLSKVKDVVGIEVDRPNFIKN